ncbi:MAG: nickel-responsive transcriptional regulator NikR [Acetobacteraceae bacterium]
MQRVTITLDDSLMAELDTLIATRGYQNRSEAIRDLTRAGLQQTASTTAPGQQCVGALVYVYDHGVRELTKRLTHAFHDHHSMAISTLHVHLDHASCMEITVLKGKAADVAQFAESIIAERGVKHGRLVTVPVEISAERHRHGGQSSPHEHTHVR